MTPRKKRRDQWRKTDRGTWTISLGRRGHRVRVFQKVINGPFYREVHVPGGTQDRASLRTFDRAEAERLGNDLLGHLLTGRVPRISATVRLGELCDAYMVECPKYLDNASTTKAGQRTQIAILCAVLGAHCDVTTLTEDSLTNYQARRRAGGIDYGAEHPTKAVRQRAVQSDLKLLKQMLRWACTRTMPDGDRWLHVHPLQYVELKNESDVRRPVATFERYEQTRAAMVAFQERYSRDAALAPSAAQRQRAERRRLSWLRAELGLFLLEATGRRRGAIMGLQWSDFNLATGFVTFRAEYDKKNRSWETPFPPEFIATVRAFQRKLGAFDGWLFPRTNDPTRPAPRDLLSQWIRKAEDAAGLSKLVGTTCHGYRRKWRSERAHLPMKAVADAGGWADIGTMQKCYDLPDAEDLLAVTSETRKRRERALA